METIQLTYPSTQQGQEFLVDNKPSAIKRWLGNLTFTDTDKTLHDLLQIIKTLNRSEHKLSHRESNLETLEQGYLQLSRHFRQHNDQRRVIPTDQQIKLLSSLTAEMAYGYKRIVHELAEQKVALKKQSRLARAINQAQHYLGLHLIEHYQQYAPIPSYIWHELHKLYHFAEQENLHTLEQKASDDSLQTLATIENSYKRNCLMAVINPYHVEGNQHWHLFKYFSHWCHKAELSSDLKKYSASECFVIDLTSSKRPEYAAADIEYEAHQLYRLLITTNLLKQLNKQLSYFEQQQALSQPTFYPAIEKNVGYKLLQQIYAYCDHHIKRKDVRYPFTSKVNLVWGISSIIKILPSADTINQSDPLEASLKQHLGSDYPYLLHWQTVNYSKGGLCVRQPNEDITQLNVGNLVLIKRYLKKQPQRSWQLGIVRWLNGNRSTGATMGIEYLHGEQTSAFYLTRDNYSEVIKHKVLLVSSSDSHQTLLIAPKNLIGQHRTIQLEYQGKTAEQRIISNQETNSLISIFSISRNSFAHD